MLKTPPRRYCDNCAVRHRAICAALDADELEALYAFGRLRSIKAGQSLIWEGDESTFVANVIGGVLKLATSTNDGRELIVGVAYPSDFIGRPFGKVARHTVTALTDAQVCAYSRTDFESFAQSHPALEHKLLELTIRDLERARRWMLLLGRKGAEEKVATFLADIPERLPSLCSEACARSVQQVELPFSRQQIANILGLTVETVSRQLTLLRRKGLIDLPSHRIVVIRDRAALEDLAG